MRKKREDKDQNPSLNFVPLFSSCLVLAHPFNRKAWVERHMHRGDKKSTQGHTASQRDLLIPGLLCLGPIQRAAHTLQNIQLRHSRCLSLPGEKAAGLVWVVPRLVLSQGAWPPGPSGADFPGRLSCHFL